MSGFRSFRDVRTFVVVILSGGGAGARDLTSAGGFDEWMRCIAACGVEVLFDCIGDGERRKVPRRAFSPPQDDNDSRDCIEACQ
jgi:hypothetical protein